MRTSPSEELVRNHQADLRRDAERWTLAREARAARSRRRAPHVPARARLGLAEALHALARRLEAGGPAAPSPCD
jgi:hypothetical protein